MPIKFSCPQCNKGFRTPDDSAGKRAKCPQCGNVLTVPSPDAASPAPQPAPVASARPQEKAVAADPGNPYRSPTETTAPAKPTGAPADKNARTKVRCGEILRTTWTIFKMRWKACTLLSLATIVVVILAEVGFFVTLEVSLGFRNQILLIVVPLVCLTGTALVCSWLQVGIFICLLKIARGQPVEMRDIFTGGFRCIPFMAATVMFGVMFMVGYLLFIVPGLIFATIFSQYPMLIVDRNMGAMDSLRKSSELTDGNKVAIFLAWLVVAVLAELLALPTLGIGFVVMVACMILMQPVVYLMLTGQPLAEGALPEEQAAQ